MRNAIRYAGPILLALFFTSLMLATGCFGEEKVTNTEQQQLNSLISEYFSSWSKPDIKAYKECFHPLAAIYYIDGAGNPHYSPLEKFIAGQEKAHLTAREPLSEKPTHISLTLHGHLAQATVRWELHQGSAAVTGTDYFMFIKTGADWRILSLIFEEDKK